MEHNAVLKRKRRSSSRWVLLRKWVQTITLLIFIGLFIWSRRGGWPANLVNLPMRLDPLTMLAHLLASRTFLITSSVALLTLILTLLFGRVWCGWLCPLGTLLDWFSLKQWRKHHSDLPNGWRGIKYGLMMIILISAFFGNLTLLFLDPLTILFRTLSSSIWPALDQIITVAETTLYRVHFLSEPISLFDASIRPTFLPSEPVFYRAAWIYAGFFLGIIGLNLIAQRFWCRYLCPLGGLLGLISKIALFRREPGETCRECSLCQKNCPTGTIDANRGYRSDPAECTMCLECLDTCPGSSIVFTPHFKPEIWHPYDPKKREALASLGLSILAIGVFRSDLISKRDTPFLLRPPGARENNLLNKCVRCSECIRACPTSALQPAISESGLEGLWTPVMIPRSGYCDYSCNACGQVCPVEAIPPLTLEEKRQQTIGKAYIDQNRCIAWADHTGCIVCEEMCPLPEKAIQLDTTNLTNPDGSITQLQLPHVLRDRCIGCGICEYKCPVNGNAAIRVYVPQTEVFF